MAKAVKSTQGSVYFVLARSVGRVKIGFTVSMELRLRELQMGSPVELELLCEVRGCLQLESTILAIFDSYRCHGEWFEATPSLMEFIAHLPHGKALKSEELVKNFKMLAK